MAEDDLVLLAIPSDLSNDRSYGYDALALHALISPSSNRQEIQQVWGDRLLSYETCYVITNLWFRSEMSSLLLHKDLVL